MNKDTISTEKNTDNKSEKRKKAATIFVVLAFVFGVIMGIFIFVVLAKAEKLTPEEDSAYLADSPLLPWVLVVIISGALMGICLAVSTSKFVYDTRKAAKAGRRARVVPLLPYSVSARTYCSREARKARRERTTPLAGPVVPPV